MVNNKTQIFFYAPTKDSVFNAALKFCRIVDQNESPLILFTRKISEQWVCCVETLKCEDEANRKRYIKIRQVRAKQALNQIEKLLQTPSAIEEVKKNLDSLTEHLFYLFNVLYTKDEKNA